MKKKIAALIATYKAEQTAIDARVIEIEAAYESGNGSDELEAEFYQAMNRLHAINVLIHEAGQPKRKICPNTQALVSANID